MLTHSNVDMPEADEIGVGGVPAVFTLLEKTVHGSYVSGRLQPIPQFHHCITLEDAGCLLEVLLVSSGCHCSVLKPTFHPTKIGWSDKTI